MYNMCVINKNINKYNMTVLGFKTGVSARRSDEFLVNRPFLYSIIIARHDDKIENSNSLTLFTGRIFSPESSK